MPERSLQPRQILPLFIKTFLPMVLLIIGTGIWYVDEQKQVVLEHYQVEARHHVEGQMNRVRRFYRHGIATLMALAHDRAINAAIAGGTDTRREVEALFSDMMRISEAYDQIRLLDSTGREVVRVDRKGDHLHVVTSGQLQDKSARYYVRQTLKSSAGTIYVSPFDLNMEHGKVQRPYKSVVRFAAPVVDDSGMKNGILVINMAGINIMQRELSETVLEGEHLLINAGSTYWFDRHVHELHVLKGRDDVAQAHRLSEGWLRVLKEDKGQYTTADGQFTFESMSPIPPGKITKAIILPQWQIVSFVPAAALIAAQARKSVVIAIFVIIVLSGAASWFWAGWFSSRKRFLQQMQQSEERFRRLVEASTDPMVIHRQGKLVYVNPAGLKIFGAKSLDDVADMQMLDYLHPDDRSLAIERMQRLEESNERPAPIEHCFRLPDGRWITVEVNSCPIMFDGQRLILTTGHDITERKKNELQREALLTANQRFAHEMIKAREDERSMLARALHDEIGQKLTAIQMHVSVMTKQCAKQNFKEVKGGLQKIAELTSSLIENARGQLKQLRPPKLDELGMKVALDSLCRDWQRSSHVNCHLRMSDTADMLDEDVQLNLYRIVQESLTNIARYAGASEAWVDLTVNEDIHLSIRDDGCGFDSDAVTNGIGLTGMRERMELLGGSMHIKSDLGKGTQLCFQIPVK